MRLLTIAALASLLVDQLSKWVVVHQMNLREIGAIEVLPPVLNFRMGWNRGINFGLFGDSPEFARFLLIGLAIGISCILIWWASRPGRRPAGLVGAGLIIGGALGNVLDRILYGAVADFLNMSCCGIDNPFIFNIADVAIFAGAVVLIVFDDTKPRDARKSMR